MMKATPNKDIEKEYKKKLFTMIRWMNKKVMEEITSLYRRLDTRIVGDARPSIDFKKIINFLKKKYERIFNNRSEDYANKALDDTLEFNDRRLGNEITKIKRKVDPKSKRYTFKSTPKSILDVKSALLQENVSLIRSIPAKYFDQIENDVYLSLAEGANVSKLTERLEKNYGIARRRAVIIARDQTNKANSLLSIKRSESIGITKGIWKHSGAGKKPRASHVSANNKVFDLNKGLKIDGEYIYPAQKINCFTEDCLITNAPVIEKLYRRWYCGETAEIVSCGNVIFRCTPNHPVMTTFGWKAVKDLKIGDQLIFEVNQAIDGLDFNANKGISFKDLFDFFILAGAHFTSPSVSTGSDFHGDGIIDKKVDIIDVASLLRDIGEVDFSEKLRKLKFTDSENMLMTIILSGNSRIDSLSIIPTIDEVSLASFLHKSSSFFRDLTFNDLIFLCFSPKRHLIFNEGELNSIIRNFEDIRNRINCISIFIKKDSDFIKAFIKNSIMDVIKVRSSEIRDLKFDFIKFPYYGFNIKTEFFRDFFESLPLNCKVFSIDNILFSHFSGHVYNLQTELGYYNINKSVVSNCRCYYEPLIDFMEE